jgi:hypothetical protein
MTKESKKFFAGMVLTLVLCVFLFMVNAYADEEGEGSHESGSGFHESCEESHDEPSSEPESSDPTPEPSPSVDPTPAPSPSVDPTPVITPSDEGSDSSSSSTTGETPQWTAPVQTAQTASTPTVVKFEAAPVKKSVTKAETEKEDIDIIPYEPPYITETEEVEVVEEVAAPVAQVAAAEEIVVAPTKKSSKPWWLLALALLPLMALAYKPYKVVARKEKGNNEFEEEVLKSFFGIKGAAKFAAETLDSKDFERNNVALKIYKKNDDRDDQDNVIDRLAYVASADSTIRSAADATDKEKKALVDCELLPVEKAKVIKLTAEAEAWEDLAKAAEA